MSEGKKVYALVESWYDYSSDGDGAEVFHRAFWLSRPTVEQVWGVVNNVHIWYTKEIVEEIVSGKYVDLSFGESSVTVFVNEYAILE